MTDPAPRLLHRWLPFLCAAAVGCAALSSAWFSDDGLVTLRTIENLARGDGFRWNLDERTQTATHPLWIMLMGLLRWLTGNLYHTVMFASLLLAAVAMFRIAKGAGSIRVAVVTTVVVMLCSRTGIGFCTGGLENPLVYLLVALFADAWFGEGQQPLGRARHLALLGALLLLARIDLVLLMAPCVVAALLRLPVRSWAAALWPGALVVLAWIGFALVYFGTAIPTPGYSKALALDIPATELAVQGMRYLLDLCWRDPATVLALLAMIGVAATRTMPLLVAPAIGLVLQILYTLKVGGDFMAGRFFTAALAFALACLARSLTPRAAVVLGGAMVTGTLLAPGAPPWIDQVPPQPAARTNHGIADERTYYATTLSMWSEQRDWPEYGAFVKQLQTAGLVAPDRTRRMVGLFHAVGVPAMQMGPLVHLVEPYICDPLLTRLPIADPHHWRIGHFTRRIPEGYLETLASGENRIHHPGLRSYYAALQQILRAPVLDAARLGTMWRFWLGAYDDDLKAFLDSDYRAPPRIQVAADRLRNEVPLGAFWFDHDCVVVREGGLRIELPKPLAQENLILTYDGAAKGRLRFLRGETIAGTVPFELQTIGSQRFTAPVPESARGSDAVLVDLDPPSADQPGQQDVAVLAVFALLGVR